MAVIPRRVAVDGVTLGIDASYSNLAIVFLDVHGTAGTVVGHFPGKKEWTTAQTLMRVFRIEDWLAGVFSGWQDRQVDAICMEGYSYGSKFGRESAAELGVTVRKAIYEHLGRVPCLVSPDGVKKFATGKARAEKKEMLLAVYKRWGFDTTDDNIADAFTLSKIARALCDGDDNLTGAQQGVLRVLESDRSWALSRTELYAMDTPA